MYLLSLKRQRMRPLQAFLLTVCAWSACAVDLNPRSYDTHAQASYATQDLLQQQGELIQQQGQAMKIMQAQLASLQNQVTVMKLSLDDCQRDLSSVTRRIDSNSQKQAAFTAYMSAMTLHVTQNSLFIFDTVVTNVGNGYNPSTGIFTAPYTGIYAFYFNMMAYDSSGHVHAAIDKSGTFLALTSVDGSPNGWDKGSTMAMTKLSKGEQVFVRWVAGDSVINGRQYTSFSGALVSQAE